MEVFVRNLPEQLSEKQLRDFFGPLLLKLSIKSYICHRLRKGCATVTFLDPVQGQKFLEIYGTSNPKAQAVHQLRLMGRNIYCSVSRNVPDAFLLRSLRSEQVRQQTKKVNTGKGSTPRPERIERTLPCSSLACGTWDYDRKSHLVFVPYFTDLRQGTMTFGRKSLSLRLNPPAADVPVLELEIRYSTVQSMTVGNRLNPSLTLTVSEAPRMYEDTAHMLNNLLLGGLRKLLLDAGQQRPFTKKRVSSISEAHESVVSSCFVYRLVLLPEAISSIYAYKHIRELPTCISWLTAVMAPARSLALESSELTLKLCYDFDDLPFSLKFQMQKLAQNGYLLPGRVVALLPEISRMVKRSGVPTTLHATKKLFNQIPYPGPETEAKELELKGLTELLARNELSSQTELVYSPDIAERHEHMAQVYKATVTPTGTFFYGPDPEPKNRVLRKYSDHVDFFLRVTFVDEDGEAIRFDNDASNENIYHGRFKKVLGSSINIAGRPYEFLGFSHSSLRAQTCWFMAPFVQDNELLHAQIVIARLGDFSAIRSPAKCAARIGQAFSETSKTVRLRTDTITTIADIERSGRVFSDGVGTFSASILHKLWKEYANSRALRPTLFQIRYAGKWALSLNWMSLLRNHSFS